MRWTVRIAAAFAALLVLAVLFVVIVFVGPWGGHFLRDRVQAQLDKTFVGGGHVGAVTGNPFGQLVVHDLVIDGPDGRPAVSVATLRVRVALLPLLSHRAHIDELIADDVALDVRRDARGRVELAELTRPGPPSSWSVALSRVELHRLHVHAALGAPADVDVDRLDGHLSLPHGGPIDGAVVARGAWRQRGAAFVLAAVARHDREGTWIPAAFVQLGGATVAATDLDVPARGGVRGEVFVHAPAGAAAGLADIALPGDLALALRAAPDGRATQLWLAGTLGEARLAGLAHVDLTTRAASAVIGASGVALAPLTHRRVGGTADLTAAIDAPPGGPLGGIVTAAVRLPNAPPASALVGFVSAQRRVEVAAALANAGGLRASLAATIVRRAGAMDLVASRLAARVPDLTSATGGAFPIAGALDVQLAASGALGPHADLTIAGTANGRDVRAAGARIGTLALTIDARGVPARPRGDARVVLHDAARGAVHFATLALEAHGRPGGDVDATVRSEPATAPWYVDAAATIRPGRVVQVQLPRLALRAGRGPVWRGSVGALAIGPEELRVTGLDVRSAQGHLAGGGSYDRAGPHAGDLAARLAGAVQLRAVMPRARGDLAANADVARRAGAWSGTVAASAHDLVLSPRLTVPLSGRANLALRGRRLAGTITASTPHAGSADIALDVETPRALASADAWRALPRRAIRELVVQLHGIELATFAGHGDAGRVTGELALAPTTVRGQLQLKGLRDPALDGLAPIDAELTLAPAAGGAAHATVRATSPALGAFELAATNGLPARPLEPGAWRALWPHVFGGGTLHVERVEIDPATLARFGVNLPLRGALSLTAQVAPGARSASATIDVTRLRTGLIARPLDVHLVARSDAAATRVTLQVRDAQHELLDGTGRVAVGLAQLLARPRAARTAALVANVRVPDIPAALLARVLHAHPAPGGTLAGTARVGGTLARPTFAVDATASDLTLAPSAGGAGAPIVQRFAVHATWDGTGGALTADAHEANGGELRIDVRGSPKALAAATAEVHAHDLEVAPLVALVPGPGSALSGRLDANLTAHGLDPRTAQLAGTLHLQHGQFPISSMVGTLFDGDLRVTATDGTAQVHLTGALGGGHVTVAGTLPLAGDRSREGVLHLTVDKVQLLGKEQPIVSATADARVRRTSGQLRADVDVADGTVKLPSSQGQPLAPIGAPNDLVFAGEPAARRPGQPVIVPGAPTPRARTTRAHPAARVAAVQPIVVHVALRGIKINAEKARSTASGKLVVGLGGPQGLALNGTVSLDSGDLDLFGRRYRIDRASATFDGTTDALLDVRISYDFPEVSTITEIRGRMSNPEIQLSSDPAIYSREELLGFLLGGTPSNGDTTPGAPPVSAESRIASAGAAYLANILGGYVKRALPVDVDVLSYSAGGTTSSPSVTIGKWLTDQLFVAYRQKLAAQPDENASEAQVEYWILRRLSLQATVGDRGYDNLDLLWRRRW